jgi:hypothetical protein
LKLTSLDKVVRGALTTRGVPIHYYFHFFNSAIRCLRELNLDIIRNINTVIIPVNANGSAILPCGYVDYVRIGYMVGQYTVDMSQKPSINRLPNLNAAGQQIPYTNALNVPDGLQNEFPYNFMGWAGWGPYYYYLNTNAYGESYEGYYNYLNPNLESFKVIGEQNRIQLDQNSQVTSLYLEYITDGFNDGTCSCCTLVSTYAIDAIEKYIIAQYAKHNQGKATNFNAIALFERDYETAVRKLATRLTPISAADIRAAFRKGYTQAAKPF